MSKAILVPADEQKLAELRAQFPVEKGFSSIILPRLGMYSQDKFEGKGKNATLVREAGIFYTEKETKEIDEEGKKVWAKEELGNEPIELTILYRRKQLSYYDEANNEFTSSPVFDEDTDVIPLFKNRKEVKRGTPAELKKDYKFEGKDGKTKDGLETIYVLYVLFNGELYQMNLRGSSMYAFMTYARKTAVPTVITTIGSEAKENGAIAWSQMTFTPKRQLTDEEADEVLNRVGELKEAIAAQKAAFSEPVINETQAEVIKNF